MVDSERRSDGGKLAAAAIAAVAVVGAAMWLIDRELDARYRPELTSGETLGLDVSHFQGEIDWELVKADGVSFAYVKATEAGDWVDGTFAANWTEAKSAGLSVGAYHFFTLCRTGADQAANFLRTVPRDADLPPAVDLEFPANCSARPSPDELRAELAVFLDAVEQETGTTALLYVEDEFDEMYGVLDAFDQSTWERSLYERPDDERWAIWQASDSARVDGVDGGVDLNVMSSQCCDADVG